MHLSPVSESSHISPTRSQPDRRRHYRVDLALGGRFLHNGADYTLKTVDISCGGASVHAKTVPQAGEGIVCYFDDLGRVLGHVVRADENGFAVTFDVGAHKKDKLADRLVWLLNQKRYDLSDERTAPRRAKTGPALVTRADGRKLQCRVMDISLSGAAFEVDGPSPAIGEIVRVGSIKCEIVRSIPGQFAVRFLHKPKPKRA